MMSLERFRQATGCRIKGCRPDLRMVNTAATYHDDYLILNINLETGQIKNWNKPAAADIEKMI